MNLIRNYLSDAFIALIIRSELFKMKIFNKLSELKSSLGTELGVTDYLIVSQEMIDSFARATYDLQWIHTDPEKAAAFSPFKTTVAHGFLTLSLAPKFMSELMTVKSVKMGLNYGTNKVRFTSAVPSGSKVRMRGVLRDLEEVENGMKITLDCTFEIEGKERPACVAEFISVLYE